MSSTITVSIRSVGFTAVAATVMVLAYLAGTGQAGASAGQPAVTGSTARLAAPAQPAAAPQIVMTGNGEATGVPDELRFSASVRTTAVDVSAALNQANATTRAVLDAVHAQGVANADVQTTGLSIRATYDHSDDVPPTITGYAVSQNMSVLVRSLPDAGATSARPLTPAATPSG